MIVQRLSNVVSKGNKFDEISTREYVELNQETNQLTLEDIKEACEVKFNQAKGTCQVLFSNKGPVVSNIEQLGNRKIYLIQFKEDHIY